jgi:hypothetical protein
MLPWEPAGADAAVSHCGLLHKLTGVQAELWLAGRHEPGKTRNTERDTALKHLTDMGIAEAVDEAEDTALFRLLTNCSICSVRVKRRLVPLTRLQRRLWRWIRDAGLHLTMAELVFLAGNNIKPIPALLGTTNRQALTEAIYTREIIFDGILDTLMEKSPARDKTVSAVLGLLRKGKIMLL